jgi:hypothetical protein
MRWRAGSFPTSFLIYLSPAFAALLLASSSSTATTARMGKKKKTLFLLLFMIYRQKFGGSGCGGLMIKHFLVGSVVWPLFSVDSFYRPQ